MLQRICVALGPIAFVGLIALSCYVFTNQQKLVYVNTGKLINEYKGMLDARDEYRKKATVWKANVDTLTSEVKRQIMRYEEDNATLSVKERKLTQDLIRTKQKQLNDYQQAINTQAQQEDEKMTSEVVRQINAYIKKYGEQGGYKIVIATTEYGNIAYADEGLDITADVLEGLNKEYTSR